jgi:hypothetical protein
MPITAEERRKALEELEEMMRAGPPPDGRPKAQVLQFPKQPRFPSRMQMALDAAQERWLAKQAELEAEASQTCHVGPGDPDYWRR